MTKFNFIDAVKELQAGKSLNGKDVVIFLILRKFLLLV